MKRKLAVMMACVLGVSMLAGCKKGNESDSTNDVNNSNKEAVVFNSYQYEELDMGIEMGEGDSIFKAKYANNAIYYTYYDMPDYPEEYYEELEKINDAFAGSFETQIEGEDSVVIEDASEVEAEDASEMEDKKDNESNDTDTTGAVTDDDLLGDMDDIFGEDTPVSNEESSNESEASDSESDTMTYEELEKKYADYKDSMTLRKYDLETGENTTLFEVDSNSTNITDYSIDKDGNIIVFSSIYNFDEATGKSDAKYVFDYYSATGEKTKTVDVTDALQVNPEENYIDRFQYIDGDRYLVNKEGEGILVVNSEGKLDGTIKFDDYVEGFVVDNEGKIVASCYGEESAYYAKADVETYEIEEKIESIIPEGSYASYTLINGNGLYPFLLKDSTGLYTYDYDSKSVTEIVKWIDCGVVGDELESVVPLEDGRIFCEGRDNMGNTNVGLIVEGTQTSGSEKQIIKIMSAYTDSDVQKKIVEFNKTSSDYKVELVTFDNDSDPITKINNEITAGNIPDIIDVNAIDLDNYISKGIMEELDSYMAADEVFNEDYYVDGFLDAIKSDGKLYYLSSYFEIVSLVGRGSELEKYKDGWDTKALMEYYNSKPEGTSLVSRDTKTAVAYLFLFNDFNRYIDWNTGEVKFDSEEFRQALEFCNSFKPDSELDMADINTYKDISEGKILFNEAYITSTEEIQLNNKLFNNDALYIGYPCKEGSGTYLSTRNAYGICAGSENKEGAWEVLKYIMTPNNSSDMDYMMNPLPASSKEFEAMIKRDSTTEKYTDENGVEITPREGSMSYEDYEVKIEPATEEEVQLLRDMIKNANGSYSYMSNTSNIIIDDIMAYFEGKKNLDETIKIIQDKMSKYVNENR